jgi:hypothetical protein
MSSGSAKGDDPFRFQTFALAQPLGPLERICCTPNSYSFLSRQHEQMVTDYGSGQITLCGGDGAAGRIRHRTKEFELEMRRDQSGDYADYQCEDDGSNSVAFPLVNKQ